MSAARLEGAGVTLAFEERGRGASLLLVHGAGATRLVWRETLEALGDRFLAIAYDRRGYGDSEVPEGYTATTVEEQADDAAAVLRELGAVPALACGHAFGALVLLDMLVREPELVRAAVLIEPPLLALSAAGPEFASELREAAHQGARNGGPGGVVDAIVGHLAGEDAAARLGSERAGLGRAAARACAADLAAGPRWPLERGRLARVRAPVAIVAGARSRPIWREVARSLAELVPPAELREIEAGHLTPIDAPEALVSEIARLEAAA